MQRNLIEFLSKEKIYPIIRVTEAQRAIDTAHAMIEGGIKVLEISVENDEIYEAIEVVSKHAAVCAGGIITAHQADRAFDAGAEMFSSPVFQTSMVKISKNKQKPFIAGASTPCEAYTAWKMRVPLIKIFPVTALGGVEYIEDILRPMPFLKVMPMGHVKLEQVADYIKVGAAAVGVGRNFYDGLSFDQITKRTKEVIARISELSNI